MKVVAIDFETYPITAELTLPKPVCLSYAFDEDNKGVLVGNDINKFLATIFDGQHLIIAHNLKFELGVIYKHFPEFKTNIFELLDANVFRDTIVSFKLRDLARDGNLYSYSLADLVKQHLDVDISESKKVDSWRLRYHELDGVSLDNWPQEAIDYSLMDSVYCLRLFDLVKDHHDDVSINADFILAISTDYGFNIDSDSVNRLRSYLESELKPIRQKLIDLSYAKVDKKGVFKKESKKLRELVEQLDSNAKRSAKGSVSIGAKDLVSYENNEVCKLFSDMAKYEKLFTSFLPSLEEAAKVGVIRTNFNVLVATGRSSAFNSTLYPSVNIQQMPRGGGIRECFIPRPGHVLVSIDYSALELHSVAQQIKNIVGKSTHADQINYGETPVDLHSFLGAELMSSAKNIKITYEEFIRNKKEKEFKHFRTLAKPVGLGFPGGLGVDKFVEFSLNTYGVTFTREEALNLKEFYHNTYPEFSHFMKFLGKGFKTGKRKYSENGFYDEYAYKIGNILRSGCNYTAFTNGILMQSLSALGAKIVTYEVGKRLEQSGKGRLLALIHDELIVELPNDSELREMIEKIAYVMCSGMRLVMPDVRITVEASIMPERWTKDGAGMDCTFAIDREGNKYKSGWSDEKKS